MSQDEVFSEEEKAFIRKLKEPRLPDDYAYNAALTELANGKRGEDGHIMIWYSST